MVGSDVSPRSGDGNNIRIRLDPGYRLREVKKMDECKCLPAVRVEKTVDVKLLDYIQYVYENFGIMPKWLSVKAY
jgi:hypothetical protein